MRQRFPAKSVPTMMSNDVAVKDNIVVSFPVDLPLPIAPESHFNERADAIRHEYRVSTRPSPWLPRASRCHRSRCGSRASKPRPGRPDCRPILVWSGVTTASGCRSRRLRRGPEAKARRREVPGGAVAKLVRWLRSQPGDRCRRHRGFPGDIASRPVRKSPVSSSSEPLSIAFRQHATESP